MLDEQTQEPVVTPGVDGQEPAAPDAGVTAAQPTEPAAPPQTQEPVVTPGVDGQEKDDKHGPAILAEVARREAKLKEQYEAQYGPHMKNLERVAKFYGFEKPEEYLAALDEAERERQIKAEAAKFGVPEEFIRKEMAPLKSEVEQLKQEREALRLKEIQLEIGADLERLRKNPDFATYEEKVFDLVRQRGYPLEDAYIIVSHKDKIAKAAADAEAEAIRNIQQNAQSSTGPLGAEAPEEKSGYMALSPKERRELRERVKRGDAVTT